MKEASGCVFVLCNFDILDSEFIADLFAARGDNSYSTHVRKSVNTFQGTRQEPSSALGSCDSKSLSVSRVTIGISYAQIYDYS